MTIKTRIRTIPDYPKPGIQFRDITTLLQDPVGMRIVIDRLCEPFANTRVDKVAGIEARGFILAGAVACRLDAGFVPVRKRGKLPWSTVGRDYSLEYGTDRVEIHTDAILEGESILIVDDLVATGGTAAASIDLISEVGGRIVGCSCIVDLPDLGGSRLLRERGVEFRALCEFEGE
jgi:adenine phosphoribosyltransferase